MYAILHIPTGKFLNRPGGYCNSGTFVVTADKWLIPSKYLFYSRKDAEKYRRSFLVGLYTFIKSSLSNEKNSRHLPRFLKKRRKCFTYNMNVDKLKIGLQSLDFYPISTQGNEDLIPMFSTSEYIIVKV